ncbi:MAG: peptidoglycan-binding protein [Prochlorothrix sp.]|nr:peptidoglycan-binding protein [Prochlorothrix sp.]
MKFSSMNARCFGEMIGVSLRHPTQFLPTNRDAKVIMQASIATQPPIARTGWTMFSWVRDRSRGLGRSGAFLPGVISVILWGGLPEIGLAQGLERPVDRQLAPSQLAPNQLTPSQPIVWSLEPEIQIAQAQPGIVLRPNLSLGDTQSDVVELQAVLRLLGFYEGEIDGVYGSSTQAAVAIFQETAGLAATGEVGPSTWDRLFPPSPGTVAPSANVGTSAPPAGTTPSASSFPVPSTTGTSPRVTSSPAPTPAPTPPAAANPPTPQATATPAPSAPNPDAEVSLPILKRGSRGSAVIQLQAQLEILGFETGGSDGVFGEQTELAVQAFQVESGLEDDGIVGPATWEALLRVGR